VWQKLRQISGCEIHLIALRWVKVLSFIKSRITVKWLSGGPFVPSECGVKMVATLKFAPMTNNINAQSCSNFRSSYPRVCKNNCLITLHILFVCGCGWVSLPVCINSTSPAAFKHFDSLIHTSLWQTVLSILGNQLSMDLYPFIPSDTKNSQLHVACPWCKFVVEQSSLHHIWTTEPHSQHVTVWPWATVWPGLSSVDNHTTKIFQQAYCPYILDLLRIIVVCYKFLYSKKAIQIF
jgi:hypothetical protein